MKKIFALLIGLISITAVFAQSGHDRNNGFNGYNQSGYVVTGGNYSHGNSYGYPAAQNYPNYYNDRRNGNYGYGYSQNYYGRGRRYNSRYYERRGNTKSFAGGAIIGAVAGVLLGSALSR